MNDLRAQLNSALGYHQAGNLVAAERIYRQVLKSQPGNADALYLMGTLAQQSGNLDAAATYLAREAAWMLPSPRLSSVMTGSSRNCSAWVNS